MAFAPPSTRKMRASIRHGTHGGDSQRQQRLLERASTAEAMFRTRSESGRVRVSRSRYIESAGRLETSRRLSSKTNVRKRDSKQRTMSKRKKAHMQGSAVPSSRLDKYISTSTLRNRKSSTSGTGNEDEIGSISTNDEIKAQSLQSMTKTREFENESSDGDKRRIKNARQKFSRQKKGAKSARTVKNKSNTLGFKKRLRSNRRRRSQSLPSRKDAWAKNKTRKQHLRPSAVKNSQVQDSISLPKNTYSKLQSNRSSSPGSFFYTLIEDISGIEMKKMTLPFRSVHGPEVDTSIASIKYSSTQTKSGKNSFLQTNRSTIGKNYSRDVKKSSLRGRSKRHRKANSNNEFAEDLLTSCNDSYVAELMRESPDKISIRLHKQARTGESKLVSAWSPLRLLQSPQDSGSHSKFPNSPHRPELSTSHTKFGSPRKSQPSSETTALPPQTPQPRRRTPRPISSKKKKRHTPFSTKKSRQAPAPDTILLQEPQKTPTPRPRSNRKQQRVHKGGRKKIMGEALTFSVAGEDRRTKHRNGGKDTERQSVKKKKEESVEEKEDETREDEENRSKASTADKQDNDMLKSMAPISARQHYNNFIDRILSDRAEKNHREHQAKKQLKRRQQAATSTVISRIRHLAGKSDENSQ